MSVMETRNDDLLKRHEAAEADPTKFSYAKPEVGVGKGFVNLGRRDIVRGAVQIVKKNGGENNLHFHTTSASFWMVLKGRVRFYRHNDDGQVEFTGENSIDHTPKDETIRIYTVNAFDVSGERRRTNYVVETNKSAATETFEIKVRNHKKEPVQVRVVEHLYRGRNWEVVTKSDDYQKKDSQTIEFPVTIAPDGEKTITYTAHYTW